MSERRVDEPVHCVDCAHMRHRPLPQLFRARAMSSEALKIHNERQRELDQLALRERERVEARVPFDFEPRFYPWCAEHTARGDLRFRDPVTGVEAKAFVLCQDGNHDEHCSIFKPR